MMTQIAIDKKTLFDIICEEVEKAYKEDFDYTNYFNQLVEYYSIPIEKDISINLDKIFREASQKD